MHRSFRSLPTPLLIRAKRSRNYSTSTASNALRQVNVIFNKLEHLETEEFRRKAFLPQLPLLITTSIDPAVNTATASSISATNKWFSIQTRTGDDTLPRFRYKLQRDYLELYGDAILPYELSGPSVGYVGGENLPKDEGGGTVVGGHVLNTIQCDSTFRTFQAPLDLLLQASRGIEEGAGGIMPSQGNFLGRLQLYVAQAQISELPQQLQKDLPVPRLVKEAGRGDIYDANIWLGIPPTYTPLHKDPNPNLFVQLASSKVVRIFSPDVGGGIFRQVQQQIGGNAISTLRSDEMMQGPEKKYLESAVWNLAEVTDGYEVVVRPGDALFIPKGWWHSIKSIGLDINASVSMIYVIICLILTKTLQVNWWFR
jgi:Cupin-like domain